MDALPKIDRITRDVIDVAMRIHRELGPGLLESVYEMILASRLARMGYRVERQRQIDIEFEGLRFAGAFKIDILVQGTVIVDIKSTEQVSRAHSKQVLTYLRLTKQPVGLLINFGGATLKEGVRRLVNNYDPSAISAPLRET